MFRDLGKNGFIWWFGKVEDVDDPLKAGRVRARIFGWHNQNINEVPTSDLPWAQCVEPITSAANEGVGTSPTGIQLESFVVGFFLDGVEGQRPMVMGTVSGVPGEEPDTSRLARNDSDFPPSNPEDKNSGRKKGVSISSGGTWDEPESAYNAKYPKNHVKTTESGHIKEYDDTPGSERIHEYHKAGTFYEIDEEGNRILRVVGKEYEIYLDDQNVYVKGKCNLTIDSDCNTKIKGDWNVKVDGDYDVDITGKKTEKVGKDVSETYSGKQTTKVSNNYELEAERIDFNK